jgi:hypothetical protein
LFGGKSGYSGAVSACAAAPVGDTLEKGDTMRISRAAYPASLAVLVCIFAALAGVVRAADARPTGPTAGASKVAGTVSARMVINRFRAVGKRVVGQGTVISTYKDASGGVSVKRKPFRLTIRERHSRQQHTWSAVQQEEPLCHILFLEVGEVDLTLAGLHATLRAFNPDEPITVRIQARRSGGVLGRLFCDLAGTGGALPTARKARLAARTLTRRTAGSTIMRARATVFAPERTTSNGAGTTYSAQGGATPNAPQAPTQVTECNVLHLIIGPVHLDLLGLIVDINKVVLDLKGIPGTLLGDIFCQLSSDPTPPPPPPAPSAAGAGKIAATVSTRMVVNRFTAVGKRVVGQGTVVATYTDMAGATSIKRSSFRLTIPKRHGSQHGWSAVQQEPEPLCQILFLEIGEVDLTLAGLHVIARAFNPDEPIRLRLRAQRSGGILGRLFCDLSEGGGVVASKRKARIVAQSLTTRMRGTTIMRVKAVIFAPRQTTSSGGGTMYSAQGGATPNAPTQVAECNVLHLILGPVHLDLLGLIADLNKILVDLKAVPGTVLGDIFCLLSSDPTPAPPPPPPPPPPAPAAARTS